jgi:hypothetical protein
VAGPRWRWYRHARIPARPHDGQPLVSRDARADRAELQEKDVDVDGELMGGEGTVLTLFFFRDHEANQLMIVEAQ